MRQPDCSGGCYYLWTRNLAYNVRVSRFSRIYRDVIVNRDVMVPETFSILMFRLKHGSYLQVMKYFFHTATGYFMQVVWPALWRIISAELCDAVNFSDKCFDKTFAIQNINTILQNTTLKCYFILLCLLLIITRNIWLYKIKRCKKMADL